MTTLQTTLIPDDQASATPTVPNARRPRLSPGRALAWAALIAVMAVTLFPFYWALRTALSDNALLPGNSGNLLPVGASLDAFRRVLGLSAATQITDSSGTLDFWLYLRNSMIVSTAITAGQVFFSSMAAYAFARLSWPGRDQVFFVFLTALMIPPVFVILPNFILIKNLGLLNTLPAIILPYFFMTPFAVFFMRQFLLGISKELEEAAMIDGAGRYRQFFGLILPIARTPMLTLAVLTFITAWGEYFWPLLVGSDPSSRVLTVALGIFQSQSAASGIDWSGLMAAALIAALPVLVLFLLVARRVINTIGYSGIK